MSSPTANRVRGKPFLGSIPNSSAKKFQSPNCQQKPIDKLQKFLGNESALTLYMILRQLCNGEKTISTSLKELAETLDVKDVRVVNRRLRFLEKLNYVKIVRVPGAQSQYIVKKKW